MNKQPPKVSPRAAARRIHTIDERVWVLIKSDDVCSEADKSNPNILAVNINQQYNAPPIPGIRSRHYWRVEPGVGETRFPIKQVVCRSNLCACDSCRRGDWANCSYKLTMGDELCYPCVEMKCLPLVTPSQRLPEMTTFLAGAGPLSENEVVYVVVGDRLATVDSLHRLLTKKVSWQRNKVKYSLPKDRWMVEV